MPNRIPARPIKKSMIEENRERLLNAPVKEKEDFSLQEAIHNMAAEIDQVLERGYSYEEVATMLSGGGIDIKPTTLRQYLAQVNKVTSKTKPKRSPKAKTDNVKLDEVKSLEIESNKNQAKSTLVETTDEAKNDIVEVAAKPSKPTVKVDKKASSGFVDMPDKL
jgi:phage antirepressor YoqD-like protein